jgi:exopolysaccharide biosynthesis predicted pyruvyltransferase EpsI
MNTTTATIEEIILTISEDHSDEEQYDRWLESLTSVGYTDEENDEDEMPEGYFDGDGVIEEDEPPF